MNGFPLRDGKGPMPDSWTEALVWTSVVVGVSMVLVFTGVDDQLQFAVSSPVEYAGLSTVSAEDGSEKVVFSRGELSGIEFSTKNRVGYDSVGDEIGLCAGIGDSGEVYDLRVAEGFEETSRTSVTYSCSTPRGLILHSQPDYSSGQSAEDKSFDGEFRPAVSCIVFNKPVVSPAGSVEGLNCFDAGTDDRVRVVVQ